MDASAIATSFAVTSRAQAAEAAGMALLRHQADAAQALVAMLAEAAAEGEALAAAPPPGMGAIVDKSA